MPSPVDAVHWYLAEDFAFSERARRAGSSIFADPRIRLWHIGTCRYGWEDAGIGRPRFAGFTLELDVPPPGGRASP